MGNSLTPRLQNAEKTGVLQLGELNLKKIPDELKRLQNLRTLDLSGNKIEILGPWIGGMKQLKLLKMDRNKLHCFPVEICALTRLETLSAANNCITSLTPPESIANIATMTHLRVINLSNNCLQEFPVEFCSASIPLELLDLANNHLTVIPSCVSLLQAVELNLNNNKIAIVAEAIADCPRLKVLRLRSNCLALENFPVQLLSRSPVSLLEVENNRFAMKDLYNMPEYQKYMDRYTAMKKKAV